MKKIYAAAFILAMLAINTNLNAQDNWVQGKKGIYSVSLGGTQVINLSNTYYYYGRVANLGLAINASGEYKVWNFIGVGWQSGVDVLWGAYRGYYTTSPAIGIPFIAKANVHILDAANVGLSDKLDVYAGLGIGGGPAFYTNTAGYGSSVTGFLVVGPQVGVRYWFGKVAVFGEFGWGATFANVGATF